MTNGVVAHNSARRVSRRLESGRGASRDALNYRRGREIGFLRVRLGAERLERSDAIVGQRLLERLVIEVANRACCIVRIRVMMPCHSRSRSDYQECH
jgi:hypothetical protein